uniref:Pyrin n=1 Tax=Loxodonta africana TaxID=9785 RepID=G3T690_LOXAF
MAKTPSDHLLNSLEELVPYDFEKFKFKLQNTSLEKEHPHVPQGLLQKARPVKLATLLVNRYGEKDAVRLTLQVLRGINQHLLAEELHKALARDQEREELHTAPYVKEFFTENKPKSLKIPDGPESDRQQQSGDGAASLQPGQPKAGRGPLKKSQDRAPQSLDGQGKPGARSMTPPSRKGPFLSSARQAGEKGCILSSTLRRNTNSTSRLQVLSSNWFSGSLGRREAKRAGGKKQPKSLDFTVSSEGGEPRNPETLLTLDKIKIGKTVTVDIKATVAPEKCSRNPERSVIQEGGTFRDVLTNVSLTRGEKTTAPLEENGIGSPEAPGKLHEPTNPKALPSSGKKGPQNPGHLTSLGMVACEGISSQIFFCANIFIPLRGRPWEGDLVGGTCVHGSSSCSGGRRALDGHSHRCPRCQTPLPNKQLLCSLSPEPPSQCERHVKQPCLLFCEDHGEPICLICSLSQEHRGHQVHPIEEVALQYQEQIHQHLEHLKELRKSGEGQKRGDKETANFLKQTEAQKQKMQQLCRFLEKQEQLFVAWLEELGQTIGQVGEKYGSRVSQDIALLDKLISELEAKQHQPAWVLVQDIGVTLHRAKTVTIPERWATPPEVKEKIHLFYHKSEFVEKSLKRFSESLRSEM